MRRLLLVRHGESAWNVERRIQGQLGTGLSPRGRRQAGGTAAFLNESHPMALLVTSDLQRCRETVAPLEATLGRRARLEEGLRERDFGDWSGRLAEEVREEEPELWRRWTSGEDVIAEIGGEGTETFTKRVVDTVERLLDEVPDGGEVVCITHGGPVWHGTRALLDLPDDALGPVANASVTELALDDTWGRRLVAWNQTSHLAPDLRATPPRR